MRIIIRSDVFLRKLSVYNFEGKKYICLSIFYTHKGVIMRYVFCLKINYSAHHLTGSNARYSYFVQSMSIF